MPRAEAFEQILSQLRLAEYASVEIGNMLAGLSHDASEADVLDEVLTEVQARYPEITLHQVIVNRHMLRLEFEAAADAAVRWADEEIFSAAASATAISLLVDVNNEPGRAIEIGQRALLRAPKTRQLVNNIAYALALGGRFDEAKELLSPGTMDSVHLTATRALIAMLEGKVEQGDAGYEEARDLALEKGDRELAVLVEYHRAIYEARIVSEREGQRRVLAVPEDWESHPDLALLVVIARREGLEVVTTDEDGFLA